ncbi:MAG: NBR1-Ig-like domain-containing protein [Anaerolineales bacterium]
MFTQKLSLITVVLFISIFGLAFSACSAKTNATPTVDSNLIFTAAAQTVEAELTLIASSAQSTPTPVSTFEPGIPTTTPAPPPDSGNGGNPPSDDCDRAGFVEDLTIPDGTVFEPGESFVKTWRLKNTGTCTWTTNYAVVFDKGDSLGGPASFQLTNAEIAPGEEVDLSVNLTAPSEPGKYRGDWKLRNPAGQVFGLGKSGKSSFWVEIDVASPPDFSAFFDNIHSCNGTPHAIFSIFNNGDDRLESAEITLNDQNTGTTLFGPLAHDGPFMGNSNECPQGGDSVPPGKKAYLGASLTHASSGQNIHATFKICNKNGMGGACSEETVDFTVP